MLAHPTGEAVCDGFVAAMDRFGVPFEVRTDNGTQFTTRHAAPVPAEVPFERVGRTRGINQRLTEPRSPATSGQIEPAGRRKWPVEIDPVVPPCGAVSLAGHQLGWLGKPFSGRSVTI